MSGTHVKISFNMDIWRLDQKTQLRTLENPEAVLKSIGEEMLPRIIKRFKSEKGPDGKRWTALSPRTIEARLKRYGNSPLTILRMRGHLAGSINYQVTSNQLRIGTGGESKGYAAIHQFGGKAGRGRKTIIPARPYLGFSDSDMNIIEDELNSYFGF